MTDNKLDWDEMTEAMEIMAKAVGAHVSVKNKFGRLRVEFPVLPDNEEHAKALYTFAELVEAAS